QVCRDTPTGFGSITDQTPCVRPNLDFLLDRHVEWAPLLRSGQWAHHFLHSANDFVAPQQPFTYLGGPPDCAVAVVIQQQLGAIQSCGRTTEQSEKEGAAVHCSHHITWPRPYHHRETPQTKMQMSRANPLTKKMVAAAIVIIAAWRKPNNTEAPVENRQRV